jgi:hypothetical protein
LPPVAKPHPETRRFRAVIADVNTPRGDPNGIPQVSRSRAAEANDHRVHTRSKYPIEPKGSRNGLQALIPGPVLLAPRAAERSPSWDGDTEASREPNPHPTSPEGNIHVLQALSQTHENAIPSRGACDGLAPLITRGEGLSALASTPTSWRRATP